MREELSVLWQENGLEIPYGCTSKDLFGLYSITPSRFKFLLGDRKLIKIISNHLTKDDEKSAFPIESAENQDPDARRTMFFINKLRSNAERNLSTTKEGYEYDIETKLYASYLRMICGPLGYNTLQRNLVGALPALVSTNRYINTSRFFVPEGVLRCKELLQYLKDRNLP